MNGLLTNEDCHLAHYLCSQLIPACSMTLWPLCGMHNAIHLPSADDTSAQSQTSTKVSIATLITIVDHLHYVQGKLRPTIVLLFMIHLGE